MSVQNLSNNSFAVYENKENGKKSLRIRMTIDSYYDYEVYCNPDSVIGKVVIDSEEHILKHTDPISNIVLKDILACAMVLCRDANAISSWQKNDSLTKYNNNWFGKLKRIIDLPIVFYAIFIIFFVTSALVQSQPNFIFFIIVPLTLLCSDLIQNIKIEKELSKGLSEITVHTKDYNKDNKSFVQAIPEINELLEKGMFLLIEQTRKKRNNKKALN